MNTLQKLRHFTGLTKWVCFFLIMVQAAFQNVISDLQARGFNVDGIMAKLESLKQSSGDQLTAFAQLVINVRERFQKTPHGDAKRNAFCDEWIALKDSETILFFIEAAVELGDNGLARFVANKTAEVLESLSDDDNDKREFIDLMIPRHLSRGCHLSNCPLHVFTPKQKQTVTTEPGQFIPVHLPQSSQAGYYARQEDEKRLLSEIIYTCEHPGKGVLVISGDPGIGKSTTVAQLFTKYSKTSLNQSDNVIVLWLNCFRWGSGTGRGLEDTSKRSFDDELVKLAVSSSSSGHNLLECSESWEILPYFKKKKAHVLFVFDDLYNADLLAYCFNELFAGENSSNLSCLVITRDPKTLTNELNFIREPLLRLEPFGAPQISAMLKDVYDLKEVGKLQEETISKLADAICCGLPLIASLISSLILTSDDVELTSLQCLMACDALKDLDLYQRQMKTVSKLFEMNISKTEDDRQCYYAFLFFDPEEAVSVNDLQILWKYDLSDCYAIIDQFEVRSLLRKIEKASPEDELRVQVHQMVYEAALESAKSYFQLPSIQTIRMKLVNNNSGEMVLFEAVRRLRRDLVIRATSSLTAENLAEICCSHEERDDKNKTFLHFLYRFKSWPDDKMFEKHHPGFQFGVNHSYRLLREILLAIKRNSKGNNGDDLLRETVFSPSSGSLSFVAAVLGEKNEISQTWERKPLIWLLDRFEYLYTEQLVKGKTLADEKSKPWLLAAIRGDINEMKDAAKDGTCLLTKEEILQAFLAAVQCGHLEMVQFLCEHGKKHKIESNRYENGVTPLWLASRNGHLDVARFLYERDKKGVSAKDNFETTPLWIAAACGHLEIVQFLAEKGNKNSISSGNSDGQTPLYAAARSGHLHVIEFLCERDKNLVSTASKKGMTPVSIATQQGHLDVVKFLYNKDPKCLEITDVDGQTPLHKAALNGQLEMVEFICANIQKNSVTAKDKYDTTPLWVAAQQGHLRVVKLLFARDSDSGGESASTPDSFGMTPLWIAAANGHLDTVRFLADCAPASVSFPASKNGATPLWAAARNGLLDVVQFLYERDEASASRPDSEGKTPLWIAGNHGHREVVQFILQKMKPQNSSKQQPATKQ